MTTLAALEATQVQHEIRISAVEKKINWILCFTIATLVAVLLKG